MAGGGATRGRSEKLSATEEQRSEDQSESELVRRASAPPGTVGSDDLDRYALLRHQRMKALSDAERKGIKEALDVVDSEKFNLEEEGLSQASFFFGVLNVVAIIVVLCLAPLYLWLLYALECLVLIPAWLIRMRRAYSGVLFVLDFCWVANISFSLYLLSLVFSPPPASVRLTLFLSFFAAATGPLGWACLALHNGLVFHNIERITSLFIHMTPTFVTWTVVCGADELAVLWPGRFPSSAELAGVTGWQLFAHGAVFYVAWLALHGAWLLSVGVDCPKHGYNTVFSCNYESFKLRKHFTKATGLTGLRSHACIYLLIHATLCLGWCFPFCVLCFKSSPLHLAFGVSLFVSSAWYGAGYYNYIVARKYTKVLHQLYQKKGE